MGYAKLFLYVIAGLLAFSSPMFGQEPPPPAEDSRRDDRRPNLLAELGLAPEQVQQIRRINQERRPRMQEARRRMGEASRSLDMAIYGDTLVSDAEIQNKLKEFQAAEAELSQLRFEGELAVRNVLTPEQLVRFRELRRRFADERRPNGTPRMRRRRGGGPPPAVQAQPARQPISK